MKFNICIALPIKSSDYKQNKILINNVLKENPELIELRFDYINDVQKITDDFVKKLLNLSQPNIPTIFTFRDYSEGGQTKLSNEERLKILITLIQAQPEYLDIEMNSNNFILKETISLAVQNSVNLIFSYHDFTLTPSYEKAYTIMDSFRNKLSAEFIRDSKRIKQYIYKLIFTAQQFEDNLISLGLSKNISNEGYKIISFCMAEQGIVSRLLCVKVGSFLTYASLDDKTAPGQINISKMRKFYELV